MELKTCNKLFFFGRKYKKNIIFIILTVIVISFFGNNLWWAKESPVCFYEDSLCNMLWAVYFGKYFKQDNSTCKPELVRILQEYTIDGGVAYSSEYNDFFRGPICAGKITLKRLLNFHLPPLWSMFLGVIFALFGFHLWVFYFAQSLLGAATIIATYFLGKKIHSSSLGILSAFILSTLPDFISVIRQGFLEVMITPVLLLGMIAVIRIINNPLRKKHYIFLGVVCGIGMLIKNTFLLYNFVFLFVITGFIGRKVNYRNILIVIGIMFFVPLWWHICAYREVTDYFNLALLKSRIYQIYPDYSHVFYMLKNIQLGNIFFIFFAVGVIYFFRKAKTKNLLAVFIFVFLGYVFSYSSSLAVIVRHYYPFLPFLTFIVCYGILNLGRFKRYVIIGVLFFGFFQGYGWLMLKSPWLDQMQHFYYQVGVRKISHFFVFYAGDINSNKLFSIFSPLPNMRQKEVYETIKGIPSLSGVRIVQIQDLGGGDTLERRALCSYLTLQSAFEGYPLIVEHIFCPSRFMDTMICEDRIWIFLRGYRDIIDAPRRINSPDNLTYIKSISFSSQLRCDLFKEKTNFKIF